MKTIVICGGTDGIGRALAEARLGSGDTVVVVGRSAAKGEAFLRSAEALGAGPRAHFVRADLSLVAENERVAETVRSRFPVVDALVFCARFYRSERTETAECLEENFALFYLSRYLLGHGLADALERAGQSSVVNVAGPGAGLDLVQWDDLQLRHGYHGGAALGQGGKLNDLLGVRFAERYGHRGIRYVLIHPGVTATGFAGEYDEQTRRHVDALRAQAKPVESALPPILAAIDAPPAEPLSAFVEGRRIDVADGSFDPAAARRLEQATERILAQHHPLDNPVRASLLGPHARFALSAGQALRYPAEVSPFAALPDWPGEDDWRDAAELLGPGGVLVLAARTDLAAPAGWEVLMDLPGVQLAAEDVIGKADEEAVQLGPEDVPEMIALVERTKPGPFLARTIEMGAYLGIRRDGELVAMAGQRLHPPGWTEISAVCTREDHRGHGFGSRLVLALVAEIRSRGETPFLHAAAGNLNAIRLYESLGFRLRRQVRFIGMRVPGGPDAGE
ncbi:MAG TPA: SDR family NAD(P)-dependent oxidoreductase [Actinocrinis sp.]|nr:SDR family NAD(P)-dependent oxidoreductase [Actinocrinis sp.]